MIVRPALWLALATQSLIVTIVLGAQEETKGGRNAERTRR